MRPDSSASIPPAFADRRRRVLSAVASIPRGRVSSYGAVAERAGLPRGARFVGRVLAGCDAGQPWHRVVAATGRISLPAGSAAFREQLRRLRAEGVVVTGGRVPARFFVARGKDLDALLWGPRHGGLRA